MIEVRFFTERLIIIKGKNMSKYEEVLERIKKEREEETIKSEKRFKEIKQEISTWPQWKQDCSFYKIVYK